MGVEYRAQGVGCMSAEENTLPANTSRLCAVRNADWNTWGIRVCVRTESCELIPIVGALSPPRRANPEPGRDCLGFVGAEGATLPARLPYDGEIVGCPQSVRGQVSVE